MSDASLDLDEASGEPIVRDEPEPDDGKVECPDCGGRYFPGPGMGVHRNAAHGGSSRRTRRKACPECGTLIGSKDLARHRRDVHSVEVRGPGRPSSASKLPKLRSTSDLTPDEVTRTVAAMLWPEGVPHEHLAKLMYWHSQTASFLDAVQS